MWPFWGKTPHWPNIASGTSLRDDEDLEPPQEMTTEGYFGTWRCYTICRDPNMSVAKEIRPGEDRDLEAILRVHLDAFPDSTEANLVREILTSQLSRISQVAEVDGRVIGHILFTPMKLPAGDPPVWGLAPMAVVPEHQSEGTGEALIRSGLDCCRARGCAGVIVMGHVDYYPRFGFRPAREWSLSWRGDSGPHLMAQELVHGAFSGRSGEVQYCDAIEALGAAEVQQP